MPVNMNWSGFLLYLEARLSQRTAHQTLQRVKYLNDNFLLENSESFTSWLVSKKADFSGSTRNKYIQAVHHYCTFRKLNWDIPPHQTEHTKKRDTFSDDEIVSVLNASKSAYKCYFALLAYTGARPSEIRLLTASDIDKSLWCLTVKATKTGEDRTIPIHDSIKKLVADYLASVGSGRLFTFSDTSARKYLFNRCKEVDIPYRPLYSFRHSLITRLVNSDVPLFQVMAIAGHKSSDTTLHYYRHNLYTLQKALKRDSLGLATMSKDKKFDLLKEHISEMIELMHLNQDKDFEVELVQKGDEVVLKVKKKKKT